MLIMSFNHVKKRIMNFRHNMYKRIQKKKKKNQFNLVLELFVRVSQIIKCDILKLNFDF